MEKPKKEQIKAQNQPPLKQTPLNHLNASSPPLDRHYYVSSLNHLVSKSSTNFVLNLSPFGNKLIKHKPREE
jgi:hypothetical protein